MYLKLKRAELKVLELGEEIETVGRKMEDVFGVEGERNREEFYKGGWWKELVAKL